MTNYLLEKSRVTGQAEGERCFHVMHYLLEGANELEREEFQLLPERWVGGSLSVGAHRSRRRGGRLSRYFLGGLFQTPPPPAHRPPARFSAPPVSVSSRSQETRLVRSSTLGFPCAKHYSAFMT